MNEQRTGTATTTTIDTKPLWRKVNPTLIALVVAIAAVAAIGLSSKEAPKKSDAAKAAPAKAEQASTAARHTVEPGAMVGALLPKHHRRHRAHNKKRR